MKKLVFGSLLWMGCVQAGNVGLSTSVEYLYWNVREGNLYPVIMSGKGEVDGLNFSDISLENQKFECSSGVRLEVGYALPCTCYDVQCGWTYIRPNTTVSFASSDPKNIIAIPFFDQTNTDAPHASSLTSHWHLNFNMLELVLGREIAFGHWFTMRPYLGLKGGWIFQRQQMHVEGIQLAQGQTVIPTTFGKVDRLNNFQGIGPIVGFDLRYAFNSPFGLFSSISGALLYGKYDLKTAIFLDETLDNNGYPLGPQLTTLGMPDYNLSPTVQMLLGADWAQCIGRGYWFRVGVAYEVQYWWDQMRSNISIPQALFANTPSNGDLMIHGLTVQATIEF